MTSAGNLANFVWTVADQLRGVYRPAQYGSVILPMTILRRLDCVLEPTKHQVLAEAAKVSNADQLDLIVRKKLKLNFYNTSVWDFGKLLSDPTGLKANLIDYTTSFSPNVADVFERFRFDNELATLDEKDRLYQVVQRFAEIDLRPQAVSNADMGSLFEELIRKFAEASNETAGEHFTPRDAIRLMVDLLFAPDDAALSVGHAVRTVYDPTAGTGGMLSVAEEHLAEQNPDARLTLYGQEINDQSYAICKSDLIGKGQDARNIQLGDTLREDKFAGRTFDYCLSNPPYGVEWKAAEKDVRDEAAKLGEHGRFGHGLPGVSDGQMLFLTHLASKMRPVKDGGGRAAIVLNGSPLFTGKAESGESKIRQWLLTADLVDAIVALPTEMFYNTGIATYVWLLDNNKPAERRGKVQLIDGTSFWSKMRKSLGSKRREMTDADRAKVLKLYDDYTDDEHSRVLDTDFFGYRTITVERPLRLNFAATLERIERVFADKTIAKLPEPQRNGLRAALDALGDETHMDRAAFNTALGKALGAHGVALAAPARKALLAALSERDENAEICRDAKGNAEPDTTLRDTENVPLSEDIDDYFAREVLPHVPDAWIDPAKTKTGYEIPFTRIFYKYVPPRPLEEIDADLNKLVAEIMDMLREVEQ
ncbi:MAG: type I restriction-modification system subunit M [Jatrophihabitans sp.]|uniref:type I restriction-modification system subunit M n=1 Tax=Jatrophihabitans sp. TaxID=1932789 RepID=UPI003F7EA3E6